MAFWEAHRGDAFFLQSLIARRNFFRRQPFHHIIEIYPRGGFATARTSGQPIVCLDPVMWDSHSPIEETAQCSLCTRIILGRC